MHPRWTKLVFNLNTLLDGSISDHFAMTISCHLLGQFPAICWGVFGVCDDRKNQSTAGSSSSSSSTGSSDFVRGGLGDHLLLCRELGSSQHFGAHDLHTVQLWSFQQASPPSFQQTFECILLEWFNVFLNAGILLEWFNVFLNEVAWICNCLDLFLLEWQ